MSGSTATTLIASVAVNSAGLFVAVGTEANFETETIKPVAAYSANGSTWTTPAAMNGSTTPAGMRSVAVNAAGLWVAVGSDSDSAPVYATSSNGISWTTPASINGSVAPDIMTSVAANTAGVFVTVGYNDSTDAPVSAIST